MFLAGKYPWNYSFPSRVFRPALAVKVIELFLLSDTFCSILGHLPSWFLSTAPVWKMPFLTFGF